MVAARGVAELSPTPTPFRIAMVASAPVMDEQNACKIMGTKKKKGNMDIANVYHRLQVV